MNISKKHTPALLLVDFQKGFDYINYWGGERNNPEAEMNAAVLLQCWRENGLPVYHIQHCSTNPISPLHETHPGNALKKFAAPLPGETLIKKQVNSAFIGTTLKDQLKEANISILVIAGLTTDHCVSTTARMAGNSGFETCIAEDATATFCKKGINGEHYPAELIHATALASLNNEFASVVKTSLLVSQII